LAVVLLGLVAALFLWPEKISPPIQATESLAPAENSSPPETAKVDPAPAANSASERIELATTDAEVDVPPSALEPQYEGDDGFTLRVIDAITRQPVPGADVYIKDQREFYRQLRLRPRNSPDRVRIRLLPLIGRHFQTDDSGVVRLPPMSLRSLAMATKGNLIGLNDSIQKDADAADLFMRANQLLTVHVVRTNGEPVEGAVVTIQTEARSYANTRASQATDALGSASFEGLCTLVNPNYGTQKFFARLEVPIHLTAGIELQRQEFTEQLFEPTELTFTLPPSGGVRIAILDSQGLASSDPGVVQLHLEGSVRGSPTDMTLTAEVLNGVAEFPYVGLGTALTAEYRASNRSNSDSISLAGPQTAGAWVEATIVATDWPVLVGVLLDSDGKPLADTDFDVRLEFQYQDSGYSTGGRSHTDEFGKFSYELPRIRLTETLLSRRCIFSILQVGLSKLEAVQQISNELQPGKNDLGEITLLAAPILLSGRVLDWEDRPISGAAVTLACEPPESSGILLGQDFQVSSDLNGAFLIQGKARENSLSYVKIQAEGFQSLRQDISLGQQGLEFRLGLAGQLLGSVRIDENIDFSLLSFRMNKSHREEIIRLRPSADPTLFNLQFEGDPESLYTLNVTSNLYEDFLTLKNISLPQGGELRPPELQPLDLRGLIHQVKIVAQNERGQWLDATLAITDDQGTRSTNMNGGAVTLISPMPIHEITLSATGYLSKTIVNPAPELTVTLERAVEVVVQLPLEFLHYRGMKISLRVTSKDSQASLPSRPFDPSGKSTLFVPETGVYEISLLVLKQEGFYSESNFLRLGSHNIERTGQLITLAVDQSALDKVVDLVDQED
jgi:hypothetical protein